MIGAIFTEVAVFGNGDALLNGGNLVEGEVLDGDMELAVDGAALDGAEYADGDAMLVGPTAVRTQRVNVAPRILTKRVMAKPRVITEQVVEPVYQRIVNKPSILREKYVPVPQYM